MPHLASYTAMAIRDMKAKGQSWSAVEDYITRQVGYDREVINAARDIYNSFDPLSDKGSYGYGAVRVEQKSINRLHPEDAPGEPFHRLLDYEGNMIGAYTPSEKGITLSKGSMRLEPYAIKAVAAWFNLKPEEIQVEYD